MTSPDAVRAMLGARSVAVVGASARPGSFGERLVTEVLRSPSAPDGAPGQPAVRRRGRPALRPVARDLADPVDLVLLAVNDDAVEEQLSLAAERGRPRRRWCSARSWSPPAPGPSLRQRLDRRGRGARAWRCAAVAAWASCSVAGGLRALGYLERDDLPAGPVALVSHSGSAFSALLRTRRRIGWTSAVSSGQELVTTTADYLEHALDQPGTRVVALVLETLRATDRLRAALDRAAAQDVPVVLLAVGGTPAASALVTAHSGALAGAGRGLGGADRRARPAPGRRPRRDGRPARAAHRRAAGASGTGRAPASPPCTTPAPSGCSSPTSRTARGVPFAPLVGGHHEPAGGAARPRPRGGQPAGRLGHRRRHPGAVRGLRCPPWPTTRRWRRSRWPSTWSRSTTATTPTRGPCSTRWPRTDKPVVVLTNVASAVDQAWADPAARRRRPGARGHPQRAARAGPPAGPGRPRRCRRCRPRSTPSAGTGGWPGSAPARWTRWSRSRCCATTASPPSRCGPRARADEAVAAADQVGYPVVLKTDERVAHKSDVGGVRARPAGRGRRWHAAYDDLRDRLGPRVVLCSTARAGRRAVARPDPRPAGRRPGRGRARVACWSRCWRDRAVGLPPLDDRPGRPAGGPAPAPAGAGRRARPAGGRPRRRGAGGGGAGGDRDSSSATRVRGARRQPARRRSRRRRRGRRPRRRRLTRLQKIA